MEALRLPARPHMRRVGDGMALVVVASLLTVAGALFLGFAAALVAPIAVLAACAAVGAVAVMVMPLAWALLLQLVLATVLAGSINYFLGFSQAMWLPYVFALALFVRAMADRTLAANYQIAAEANQRRPMPPVFFWLLVFYLTAMLISYVLNRPSLGEVVVSSKNYLFMWGCLAALLALPHFWLTMRRLWQGILWIACLQLPVVLYQKLFIASGLSNAGGKAGLSWDAVNGTFGGSTMGGQSSVMAMYIVLALAYAWIRMREGMLKARHVLLLVLLLLPSILMAEVKAAILWLAIAAGVVFGREVLRRPVVAVSGLLVGVVLIVAIAITYRVQYYDPQSDSRNVLESQIGYIFDTNNYNRTFARMGRFTSLVFWRDHHALADPHALFGYGPGASRSDSTVAEGSLSSKYYWSLDTHAASAMLWDIGWVGFVSFGLSLLAGAVSGLRLARDVRLSAERRMFAELAGLGLLLSATTLVYTRATIDNAASQFIIFCFVAVILRARAARETPRLAAAA